VHCGVDTTAVEFVIPSGGQLEKPLDYLRRDLLGLVDICTKQRINPALFGTGRNVHGGAGHCSCTEKRLQALDFKARPARGRLFRDLYCGCDENRSFPTSLPEK